MQLIDLTHPLSPDMPVYPGTAPPVFVTGCSIAETGFLEKKITLYSHTGTHIDAPAHLIQGAKTLDQLPLEQYCGKALVLRLGQVKNQSIGMDILSSHESAIRQVEFLLIDTGWHRYWGTEQYYVDYPVLSVTAADWLSRFELKGIGFDTISADMEHTKNFFVHKAFLQQDIIIIENLTRLEKLPRSPFRFSCFPLTIEDADGSPVRAVAYME